MSAELIPFPLARRGKLVATGVRRAMQAKPENVEDAIDKAAERAADRLYAMGVPGDVVWNEFVEAKSAIRAALWRHVFEGSTAEGNRSA